MVARTKIHHIPTIAAIFIAMVTAPKAGSAPRIETQTITSPLSFVYTLDQNSDIAIAVPEFDNSRQTLISATLGFNFDRTLSGTYRNFYFVPFGTVIFSASDVLFFDLKSIGSTLSAVPFNADYHCVNFGFGSGCNAFTATTSIPHGAQIFSLHGDGLAAPKMVGGSIPISVSSRMIPNSGDYTGVYTHTGNVEVRYRFDAKTAKEYGLEAFNKAASIFNPVAQPAQFAREFRTVATSLRQFDAYSSINHNIKEVEYFGLGLTGAYLLKNPDQFNATGDFVFDAASMLTPLSAPAYVALKWILGSGVALTELPISRASPADIAYAYAGYGLGLSPGTTPVDAFNAYFDGLRAEPVPQPSVVVPLGAPVDLRLIPGQAVPTEFFYFGVQDTTRPVILDPPSNDNHVFAFSGASVRAFRVLDADGVPSLFRVFADGMTFDVFEGELFDLAARGAGGPAASFGIQGLENNFDVEIYFANTGNVLAAELAFASPTPVPEPRSIVLMLVGVVMVQTFARLRGGLAPITTRRRNPRGNGDVA